MPRNSQKEPQYLDAEPTKRFFVRMLVRDIELVPAIVDLVDNSVDGAHKQSKDKRPTKGAKSRLPLERYSVDITLSDSAFVITDNCGGIALDDAVRYAFRFGRPEDVAPLEGEVGQFGVGMKRALFKLGQSFAVTSVAEASEFEVVVDVPAWLEDRASWRFPLKRSGPRARSKAIGTTIQVKDLLPSVASEFAQETFAQRLRDQIEFRHSAALDEGLRVRLNGHRLKGRAPRLLLGDAIQPHIIFTRLLRLTGIA